MAGPCNAFLIVDFNCEAMAENPDLKPQHRSDDPKAVVHKGPQLARRRPLATDKVRDIADEATVEIVARQPTS